MKFKVEYLIYGLIAALVGFIIYSKMKSGEEVMPAPESGGAKPVADVETAIASLPSTTQNVASKIAVQMPEPLPEFNGTYRILFLHSGHSIYGHSILRHEGYQNKNEFKFLITPKGNGYYSIIVTSNYNAFTLRNNSVRSSIDTKPFEGKDSQLWKIKPVGQGLYSISNKQSNLVIGVVDASQGAHWLEMQTYINQAHQKVSLVKVG